MEELKLGEKELLKKKLDEEIKALSITKENLITSIHDLNVHREADKKVDEVMIQRDRNKAKKEIVDLKNSLQSQIKQVENQNASLKERETDVGKREEEVKDAKFWLDKLQTERVELYNLRKKSENMMTQAQEKMGEVNAFEESHQAKTDELVGREKVVENKEKNWNDRIGEVEVRERNLRDWESDLTAREKALEPKKEEVLSG